MDILVYGSIVIMAGFVIWMIFQFMKEWPNYSRKKSRKEE